MLRSFKLWIYKRIAAAVSRRPAAVSMVLEDTCHLLAKKIGCGDLPKVRPVDVSIGTALYMVLLDTEFPADLCALIARKVTEASAVEAGVDPAMPVVTETNVISLIQRHAPETFNVEN